jgi:hypothetical protein
MDLTAVPAHAAESWNEEVRAEILRTLKGLRFKGDIDSGIDR